MSNVLGQTRTFETFFDVKLAQKAPGTRKQYHYALQDFEDHIKIKYNLNLEQKIHDFKSKTVEEIIDTIQLWINKSKIEMSNRRGRVCQLNTYLRYRGIRLDSLDMKDLEYSNDIADDRIPITIEQAQQLLSHCKPREKALWLAMLQSGMAIGEACHIKMSDLDFSFDRVRIVIKHEYTKKGRGRTTFLSKEAYKALKPLIQNKGPNDFVFHDRPDPVITTNNEMQVLRRVVDKLDYGKKYKSGTREITSHNFRAFFFTKAVQIHGVNYAHKMTGHKGHLMEYDRYDDKVKLDMYLKLEPKLLIFELEIDAEELETIKERLDKTEKQYKVFRNMMAITKLEREKPPNYKELIKYGRRTIKKIVTRKEYEEFAHLEETQNILWE